MSGLSLSLCTSEDLVAEAEQLLEELGALAVTLTDAKDDPVLEPAPGATPLWSEVRVNGYFPNGTRPEDLRPAIEASPFVVDFSQVPDQDWVRAWMADFHPMQFGENLWIVPLHSDPPDDPDATIIRLDPGLAFGTGTHATTALCLEYLDQHPPLGERVLDFGCGSGILAIAAARLGAEHIDAVDIDPQAALATAENARVNDVSERIKGRTTGELQATGYDVVMANILAGILVENAAMLASMARPGGTIVLSGILASQAALVMEAYRPAFANLSVAERDGWVRITGQRRNN